MYKSASKFQKQQAYQSSLRRRPLPYASQLARQNLARLEVLARELFGRRCRQLSKAQLAALSEAATKLAGLASFEERIEYLSRHHQQLAPSFLKLKTIKPGKTQAKSPHPITRPIPNCPLCHKQTKNLDHHLKTAHGQFISECPNCFAENLAAKPGAFKCAACRQLYTIGDDEQPAGREIECPDCCDTFYFETSLLLHCPRCGIHISVNDFPDSL